MCPDAYLHLYLNLYLDLRPSLYRELFEKSYQPLFQQLFATLFGSMFDLMSTSLWVLTCLVLSRQMQLPRRPVGRGVGGRIVAGKRSTTTYR